MEVRLTKEEAAALLELIDQLSGCNLEDVFTDPECPDLEEPTESAVVKLKRIAKGE